jgi:prevent-host-death family protein
MEKTLSLSEAKMKLNRLVEQVIDRDDEFIITKNGSPVAAVVPASVYEGWKETKEIQADPEFMKEIRQGVARLRKKGKRHSFEDVFGEPLK